MGVINRSPESANKDVYADSPQAAVSIALRFRESGVEVIDVGGQSTNFENPRIAEDVELDRLIPTVAALAEAGFVVSADTFRPAVAQAAVDAGAAFINDTAGLSDAEMIGVVAEVQVPVILMHLEGDQPLNVEGYDDAIGKPERIASSLAARMAELEQLGIGDVIVDPGTGISYRTDYDRFSQSQFEIAERLGPLTALNAPVLYAVPRKKDRYRNVALAVLAMASGAAMLRIHDVEMISDVAWLMRRLPNKPSGAT
jgi:dihydropteroate synthase